jgi:superfamily I DNA/RNA helicase/mRNA-degrading endonuclease RelE of RelBE toxin-antitoxin system
MDFKITHAESFPLDLGRAPKKVQNAWDRTIVPILRSTPDRADPPQIKRLVGYKKLWRLKVSGDYRLVYRLEQNNRTVTMLMLDNRAKIYKRLGANAGGEPGIRIVAKAQDLIEPEPSKEEIGLASIAMEAEKYETKKYYEQEHDRPLPELMETEKLKCWGVPDKYWQKLLAVDTENELLALDQTMPAEVLSRVLNGIWPSSIEEVTQQAIRVAEQPSEIKAAAEGARSLESFLLKLDDDQKTYVSRFEGGHATGPWLLKGGPGSGKSTVALYCIRSILEGTKQLTLEDKPLKILFTTYTKSLINASRHLLKELNVYAGKNTIDILNVDKLATKYIPEKWKTLTLINEDRAEAQDLLNQVLRAFRKKNTKTFLSSTDTRFLLDEINWIIIGNGVETVEEYVQTDRTGRRRALTESQRRQLWTVWEMYQDKLRYEKKWLFSERVKVAAENVTPQYDYVFIDEAQDLKPVAIRFCIRLCRDPRNVFLTADSNQSIYGNGISWSSVATDLRFSGRAKILKRNYRTTTENWDAIKQLAPGVFDIDQETLDIETIYHGPYPVLVRYDDVQDLSSRLNEYLHEALLSERITPGCAAVLCPTLREIDLALEIIDPCFNAKAMSSGDVDLAHPGVKILTMHASKGLEFAVVALIGVEEGRLPLPPFKGVDESEHNARQRRLFFVACSRAMRRLIVFADKNRPSQFTESLTDEYWDIEDL